ncbi:ABC transporter permease [Fluviicola taffensis]|uniref:Gliding motility protein GldF n=1 Tax=Fluviicola taffensis (strain DSM 16823 / NCIMB 13979 / RW262) TaxID=755732 RepID=F2ID02_FLUTR|nr:ABC transporter permease [Fluviicola taffensis]AEA44396.1 gliding motility protein GldF [Fluviicola taffensis DSM 16823]
MKALYWKEIRSFLGSIIGYIFIVIFLITSGIFHWVVAEDTNLLNGEEVDLIPFFNLSPIIFLVLIPAITMRMIAEERKTGTIELLFTRPITDFQIIAAKYLAGVTLLIISLLPTLIYYYSMVQLGVDSMDENGISKSVIDEGATFTSYLGLILLGSTFIAIGIFSSAVTSNQIVAFIVAMFLCWLFYDGFELLGSFNLMGDFDIIFQYIGLTSHYKSIMKGVIDTSDLIYFFGMIVLFLAATLTVVKSLKR